MANENCYGARNAMKLTLEKCQMNTQVNHELKRDENNSSWFFTGMRISHFFAFCNIVHLLHCFWIIFCVRYSYGKDVNGFLSGKICAKFPGYWDRKWNEGKEVCEGLFKKVNEGKIVKTN